MGVKKIPSCGTKDIGRLKECEPVDEVSWLSELNARRNFLYLQWWLEATRQAPENATRRSDRTQIPTLFDFCRVWNQ